MRRKIFTLQKRLSPSETNWMRTSQTPKYIASDSDFKAFIMDDYLPRQMDELPSNKWEEEYQGVDYLPEVDEIDGIHKDGNNDSYNGFIRAEYYCQMVQGTHGSVKGLNGETIGSYHTYAFLSSHEY